jgi:hypothetical protein
MKIRRKTLILFAILAILIIGVVFRNKINYDFFTYTYRSCYNEVIDDSIKMVNKIDPEAKIVDLSLIEYYQLKVFVNLPSYDQRAQVFDNQRVSNFISLPMDINDKDARNKAGESIVDKVSDKWCKRPSLMK